jgi:phosphatidylglycerophosphate synthase
METSSLIGTAIVPLSWYKKVLPTTLTVSRAYATIVILVLFEYEWYLTGLAVMVAAEATDYLDGYLARRWRVTSPRGAFIDTLVDKLLHVPLFSYFLFSPKPKLPHFFLIHDVVVRIGYGWLLLAIASIEVFLIATRFSKTMQKFIDWLLRLLHIKPFVDLQVIEKKDANIFGKIKTWIHAFSISFYTVAVAMVVRSLIGACPVLIPSIVTAAQVLAIVAVVFAILSLQSRFTLRIGRH